MVFSCVREKEGRKEGRKGGRKYAWDTFFDIVVDEPVSGESMDE